MSVQFSKLAAFSVFLLLPLAAFGQTELLPLPGNGGSIVQRVAQLFEAPTEQATPTVSTAPKLEPTPAKTTTPETQFNDMVLQLPGQNLIGGGQTNLGQPAATDMQSISDNLPFESPLVNPNAGLPNTNTNPNPNPSFGPLCPGGNCGNRRNDFGPQIYSGLDPNSSFYQGNTGLGGAAEIYQGTIPGAPGEIILGSPMADGSIIMAPPVPGSPVDGLTPPMASIAGSPCDAGCCGSPSDCDCGSGGLFGSGAGGFAAPNARALDNPGLFANFLNRMGWDGGCGNACERCPRFYGSAEYLYWWSRGQRVPPLVTASPAGTPVARAGVLGFPETRTVFGGGRLDADGVSGGRFRAGINLDCRGCNRIEADVLFLDSDEQEYIRVAPTDGPIFGRPFYNVFTGQPDAELVGFPGLVEGSIRVSTSTDFRGYGILWRHNLLCCGPRGQCNPGGGPCNSCCEDCCGGGCGGGGCGMSNLFNSIRGGAGPGIGSGWQLRSFDVLLGWRHYDLDESLRIQENLTSVGPASAVPVGTTLDIEDYFRTTNDFDGLDVGFGWEWGRCRWGLNLLAKIAFGQTRNRAYIDGSTVIATPGVAPISYPGGLLALDSNIGRYDNDQFTVIPELGANMYYCLWPGARLTFGYSLIYFDDVFRPGGLIDPGVDPRRLPPPVPPYFDRPIYTAATDNFWAQGLNLGFEFCF